MPRPRVYQTATEAAIATYNYTDIAEGTGVVTFYGAEHQETTVSGGYLSSNKGYSNTVKSFGLCESTAFTKAVDKDFDVKFNKSHRVKGKIRATLTLGTGYSQPDANNSETYAVIKAIHIDSSDNETAMGNATTKTLVKPAQAAEVAFSQTMNVEIDITDEVHFKKGETLRVTVEVWGKKTSTKAGFHGFGHDPMDRDDDPANPDYNLIEDADTTIFAVHVPFILDL